MSRTFHRLAAESTSGLDRGCVLLPLLQLEQPCQSGIPADWRHDIIYLFCTIRPPSSHYLSFLELLCARGETEEQNVSVAKSHSEPSVRTTGSKSRKGGVGVIHSRCALTALLQQVEHFWVTAGALNNEPEFTQLGRNRSQGHLHLRSSDQLPKRCCTLKPCRRRG